MLPRLIVSVKGNITLLMAGAIAAGVVISGSVLDYMSVVTQKQSLQGLADKAALADRSDYTIIIAKEFELRDGPELVLNTDYAASQIPVPDGLGDKTKSSIRLVR